MHQVASERRDGTFMDQLSSCLTFLTAPLCRVQAVEGLAGQSKGFCMDGKAGRVEEAG